MTLNQPPDSQTQTSPRDKPRKEEHKLLLYSAFSSFHLLYFFLFSFWQTRRTISVAIQKNGFLEIKKWCIPLVLQLRWPVLWLPYVVPVIKGVMCSDHTFSSCLDSYGTICRIKKSNCCRHALSSGQLVETRIIRDPYLFSFEPSSGRWKNHSKSWMFRSESFDESLSSLASH